MVFAVGRELSGNATEEPPLLELNERQKKIVTFLVNRLVAAPPQAAPPVSQYFTLILITKIFFEIIKSPQL